MNHHWHEQIQRYMNGQSSAEEAAALQAALNEDAELRALYLDYMNLDMTLSAAAEMVTITENGTGKIATFQGTPTRLSPHYWRWLAAAAACAALAVFAVHPRHRKSPRPQPDIATILSSTQSHIARLSAEPPSLFPAWSSPTASLLEEPRIPR